MTRRSKVSAVDNSFRNGNTSKTLFCHQAGRKATWVVAKSIRDNTVNIGKLGYLLSTLQPSLASCMTNNGLSTFYREASEILLKIRQCVQKKIEEGRTSTVAPITETTTEVATEAETEAATEVKTEATTEAQTEAATEVVTEAATEAQTEAATEVQTEAATEAQTEAATEVETEAATEVQTEAETEAQTEAVTEAQTEAATEAQTEAVTEI